MSSQPIRAAVFVALCSIVASAVSGPSTALAHVTLETAEAPADSFYKAAFRVPHGCEGTATVSIRIQIPDGVSNVKPQQKAGWQLAVVKVPVNPPLDGPHGSKITETIREVSWSGGHLLDENYDEFWMQVRLPNLPESVLYFPVVQQCEKGMNRWIEIPEAGKPSHDLKAPAPRLRLKSKM
jgi:periplasmic copper chaperone A